MPLPLLVWGLVSGAVIDRVGRRTIILACQSVNVLGYAAVGLLMWTGHLAFWHLCAASFVLGSSWAFDWPARRSYMPDLVGRSRTVDAIMLESSVQIVSRILGPLSGGALIDAVAPEGCYVVLVGISLLSLIPLTRLSVLPQRSDGTSAPPAWNPIRDVVEGLRYVRGNEAIFGTFLITLVMNYLAFSYMTLLPVFARDVLGQGATGLGILGMANGVGALIGLLVIKYLRGKVKNGLIFTCGSAFSPIALFAFSNSTHFELSFVLLVMAGVGQAAFGIMQSSIVLLNTSDHMRSRTMGSIVIAIGAGPPGRLQIGALAEAFGAPVALSSHTFVCAIAILTIAILMPGLRRAGEHDPAPPPMDERTAEGRNSHR